MNGSTSSTVSALRQVTLQIREHEQQYDRVAESVQLLAVSKRKPASAILEAREAGQLAFGENYVDEGVEKILSIADPSIEWHFIGAIQSRKCNQIAEHFDWAHGVDRLKTAERLSRFRPESLSPLNVCLQVNLDNESSKSGLPLEEVAELASACQNLPGITLRGLMAIPAPRDNFEQQRQVFDQLRQLLTELQIAQPELDTLSMGMSADMEAAIAEGATIVRVGTAIFGARDS